MVELLYCAKTGRASANWFSPLASDGLEFAQELDELAGGDFGLHEVAIGLVLYVGADVVSLFEVCGNDNTSVHLGCFAGVTERTKNFYTGYIWHHEVKEDYVVAVGLGSGKSLLAVELDVHLIACLCESPSIEFTYKVFILYAEDFFELWWLCDCVWFHTFLS